MSDHSPHELINRDLPTAPDAEGLSPRISDEMNAYTQGTERLISDLRETVAHLEKRVIEARIAMHRALEGTDSPFKKAWEAHELDPYAERQFFTQNEDNEDNLEPARRWILADN